MPTIIVCFYIECKDQEELEKLLRLTEHAFYDATQFDSLTSGPCSFSTLEEIECAIEGK